MRVRGKCHRRWGPAGPVPKGFTFFPVGIELFQKCDEVGLLLVLQAGIDIRIVLAEGRFIRECLRLGGKRDSI
jgi:hypothetical protein